MTKLTQLLSIAICIGITLVALVGCGDEPENKSGSIVGTWASGDTELWFYGENEGSKYLQLINSQTFDSGTYTTSGDLITMSSNGGHSSSNNYTIFDNNTKLNGFTDGYGNSTTYHRTKYD